MLCVDSACGGSEEGTGSPRTGATEDCELPCGGWELNWGPKPEQADIELPRILMTLPPDGSCGGWKEDT